MFKDVKMLIIKETEEKVELLKNKERELCEGVATLKEQLFKYERNLSKLERDAQSNSGAFKGKKISKLKCLFNTKAREKYDAYQKALADLTNLPRKIAVKEVEVKIAEQKSREKIINSGLEQELEHTEALLRKAEFANSLADLKMTLDEAVNLLENNNMEPIWDESDNVMFDNPRNYRSRADLIAVHKMDIMPTGSRLVPIGEAGVKRTQKINLDGKDYEYSYALDRKTVHFSMNGEVSSHQSGDWEECHYTVMQPFDEIPTEKIGAMVPNDTYTRGSVELTKNAWILCPANEVQTVRDLNPQVHVIGYKNSNANNLAPQLISQLGYHVEEISSNGWCDSNWETGLIPFQNIAKRENIHTVQHSESTDSEDEDFQIAVNKVIAIVKLMIDNNLIQSPADYDRLRPQLDAQAGFKEQVAEIAGPSHVTDKNLIDKFAIVANRHNIQVLAKKMADAGIPMSAEEQATLQTRFENPNYEEVFALNGDQTTSELVVKIMMNCAARAHSLENQSLMGDVLKPQIKHAETEVTQDNSSILW